MFGLWAFVIADPYFFSSIGTSDEFRVGATRERAMYFTRRQRGSCATDGVLKDFLVFTTLVVALLLIEAPF